MGNTAGCSANIIKSFPLILALILPGHLVASANLTGVSYADSMINTLSATRQFSPGNNGFVARKSNGQKMLDAIANAPDTINILLEVAMSPSSTPEGKLYAACGLRKINFRDMDAIFGPHLHLEVAVLRGDILSKESFLIVYNRIRQFGCD